MNARVLLLAALLATCSCRVFAPSDSFTISGRLSQGFECLMLRDGGKTFELSKWNEPVPTLGSLVTLRVKAVQGYASFCMVGQMVEVLRVVRVVTDFRTEPVTGSETWSPNGPPIVLGQVEVLPGASLTILPGTVVTIILEGALIVHGELNIVGTPTDLIRVTGGSVFLDSAQAASRVSFASIEHLHIRGRTQVVDHLTGGYVSSSGATLTIQSSSLDGITAQGSTLAGEGSSLGRVDGLYSDFGIAGSTLTTLSLSYSRATVRSSRFVGQRAYLLFHGASGGMFERNTFEADETAIDVRHTSDPTFHENSFLSPSTRVATETYQLQSCVRMERNWWGTTQESQIAAKIAPGSDVCYSPWLTAPPPAAGRPIP